MSFTEITGPEYTQLLLKRLRGEVPELTWLRQFREILKPNLQPGVTILDVGCATGYAYNSFKEFGAAYTGLEFETEYLKIAREWFADAPEAEFLQHDLVKGPLPKPAEIVITSATLEHLPSLKPALQHLADAAQRILMLRASLGEHEEIHTIPSPVPEYRDSCRKHNNQYSFKDVLAYLQEKGFRTRLYRDNYTDSLPGCVDGTVRTFYIVYAEKSRIQSEGSDPLRSTATR